MQPYGWCIEFRTSHESFFIMQVFPDQASHRDRVLFEFKPRVTLKRKSNYMPFSVVQGGVGSPPTSPTP